MAIRIRRGTDAQRLTVVLQDGEIAWTTDTQEFFVGDGVTLGGIFIGPGAVGAFVPLTRNITINGITQDLSVDRTWTIAGGVSSVNTATGAVSLLVSNTGTGGTLQWNTTTLEIPEAAATKTGLLSSTDWSTFNNKVTSISAGTGISVGGTTTVPIVTNTAPDQVVALTAGTGIGITGAYPNFTITNSSPSSGGTVTSVGLALPTEFAISGSPVTGAGTLTGSWNAQSANTVLSGPTSGGAATPTFRALVSGDIPDISATYLTVANAALNYQPLDSDLTTIAGLAPANDDIIQRKAGAWTNRTIAQYYADLQPSVKNDVYFTFLCLYGGATPLADSSVWHFLNSGTTPAAGNLDTSNDFSFGYGVTLIAATLMVYGNTTSGTAELVTFSLRNTTQNTTTTIGTTAANGGSPTFTANAVITGLNIAIGASDFFTLRVTNPVWVTNPVGVVYRVLLTFKRA